MWPRAQLVQLVDILLPQGAAVARPVALVVILPLSVRHLLAHAQAVALVFILLLPVRHLLAPARPVALVVILSQQEPRPAAHAQDVRKGAILPRRVRHFVRHIVPQESLVTILRWRCLDPLTWW